MKKKKCDLIKNHTANIHNIVCYYVIKKQELKIEIPIK